MTVVEIVLIVLLISGVVAVVGRPLRNGVTAAADQAREIQLEELEAAKESKYREIRDTELDRSTGKLSEDDWRGIDRQLRAEAVEILRRIDKLGGARTPADAVVAAEPEAEPADTVAR